MAELTLLSALLDIGLPGVLLVGIVILWRQNQDLLKLLLQEKNDADNERATIAKDIGELKFWSSYKGDTPPGHDPNKLYADDLNGEPRNKPLT